jgi:glycosyltransferase involved in cell wall biosynthesis/SAM-dependent methyltransferase
VRVLSVIHYPVFGGPHNRNIQIAPLLRDAGIEPTVLLPDEPGDAAERLRAAGVPVQTLPLHRIRGVRQLEPHIELAGAFRREVAAVRSLIEEGDYNVVLINGLVNPQAGIAGARESVGVVWQLLDTHHPMTLRRVLMPLVTSQSDVVMSTGRAVAAAHPGAVTLGDRLLTFFPAVDFDLFAASEERRLAARAELGLGENDIVVGNVSNLNPMKDHRNFVRAAARVHEQRPDVRFVILGAQYEHRASYVRELLGEAASLGREPGESLFIHEPGTRVAALEPAFDLFWLTSRPASEGVPTVVGEAMALELPVVATDVGSVREAVEDGVSGAVVPPLDPLALAEATLPYLDDTHLRRIAGKAGRRRALELFSVEACAAAHIEAIERAATRAAVRRASHLSRISADRQPATPDLRSFLACPACRGDLAWADATVTCLSCGAEYDVIEGIPVLLPPGEGDAWKAQQAAFFDHADRPYEVSRPHGTGSLYTWLLGEKFRRSLAGLGTAEPGTLVLTVCGGSGLDAEYLARAGFSVVASDISLEAARRTRERAARHGLPIAPIVADVEALPFRDRSVELVYVHDGLHHLEAPLRGLDEMLRTARGAVSVNEPARAQATLLAARVGLAEHYEDAGNFIARVDPEEIEEVVRNAGFEVLRSERYAMLYRHEPGRVSRLLSTPGLFGVARNGLRAFNAVAGARGNKMTLQAVRRES